MKPTHLLYALAALVLLCAGCSALAPTASPSPAPTLTATVIQAVATASPAPAATLPPPAPATPAPPPSETPLWPARLHVDPNGLWGLQLPAAFGRIDKLDGSLTRLTGSQHGALVAIDSYQGDAGSAGNTGEGLRNRARDAVATLYGQGVTETAIVEPQLYPWQTGLTFTTASGAAGEALYMQPGRDEGDYRVYGFVLSYEAPREAAVRPMLEAMRDTFKPATALPLEAPAGSEPLWAIFSTGLRAFNPTLPCQHWLAIYSRNGDTWQQRAQMAMEIADYAGAGSVRQVPIEPGHIWLAVDGGAGAHGGAFELISYAGNALTSEVQSSSSSPGAASVEDVDGDGTLDVVLNQTDNYVFCYACSVRYPQYQVLRWDGARFVEVRLAALPTSAPEALRGAVNRAVTLAQAGLWKTARAAADLAPPSQDATATWDVALIRLHAEAFAELAREGAYPLLNQAFYGDYAAALNVVRPYTPAQIFDPAGPLIAGTPAEGSVGALAGWLARVTTQALTAQPDLAAAYYLRGWAAYLAEPGSTQALADVEHAAQLAPGEPLFAQTAAWLRER
ncbi:MAG TPA: hypothetical protein PLJ35_16185 [Anaerolineae bacterium]|nr:hypothetical protein [Anaerolineae bacterium]HOR00351.1 hypothetical protein [Anaerolineae bacterium]HPL26925.1 hypothetical protein [Anaerolineae bacterium]